MFVIKLIDIVFSNKINNTGWKFSLLKSAYYEQSCLLSHWFCLLSTNIKITLQSKRWLVQEQETGLDGSFTTPRVTWYQDHQPQLGLDVRVQHLHGGTTCQPAQRQAVQQCGPRPRGPEPLHWGPPVLPQGCQVKHLSTVRSSHVNK